MERIININQIVKIFTHKISFIPTFEKHTYRKSFFGIEYGKEIPYYYCVDCVIPEYRFRSCSTILEAKTLYLDIIKHEFRYNYWEYNKDEDGFYINTKPYIVLLYSNQEKDTIYFNTVSELEDFVEKLQLGDNWINIEYKDFDSMIITKN